MPPVSNPGESWKINPRVAVEYERLMDVMYPSLSRVSGVLPRKIQASEVEYIFRSMNILVNLLLKSRVKPSVELGCTHSSWEWCGTVYGVVTTP